MQFRRSGQRDPRRRRVLAELLLGISPVARRSDAARVRRSVQSGSENYDSALFMDNPLRLTDLVPRRLVAFLLLLVSGLLVVAGLEALYAWTPRLAGGGANGRIAAFDLAGKGSLAIWFSSTLLLSSTAVAVVVYTVRRHKKDDYQGHYHVWLWAALCWLILSADQSANLHDGFKEMMTAVTGTRLVGDGSMWWMIAYFFLLGGVGMRLLVDMRRCWLSTAAVLMAPGCNALAVFTQLGMVLPDGGPRVIMLAEGARMVGNLFLLLAMGLHARYVILDAEGLLPQREPDEDEDDEQEAAYDQQEVAAEQAVLFGQPVHVHLAPAPAPATSFASRASTHVNAFTAGMAAAESQVRRKLTKQEKKALRRRLETMRRERRSA